MASECRSTVVSLPMRDGNSIIVRSKLPHRYVVSLPMRDGNVLVVQYKCYLIRVVSLPMRDGNNSCPPISVIPLVLLAYL